MFRSPSLSETATDPATVTHRPARRLSAAIAVAAVTATGITGALALTATAAGASGTTDSSVSVTASSDTYTSSVSADNNYGSSTQLVASGVAGHEKISYLKFSIPAVARGHITSAHVVLTGAGQQDSRIGLRAVGTDWSQSTLTYDNAPTRGDIVGAAAFATTTSIAVASADVQDLTKVAFAVKSHATDSAVSFASSEAGSGQPQLVLTYTTPPTTPTTSPYAPLGLAVPGGDPAGFQTAIDAGLTPDWDRLYASGTVPATLSAWPDAQAAATAGHKLWLSLALPVTALAAGTYDTALAAFVATLPAGTRLTTNHEPSNRAKNISPAAFAAAWNHAATVITTASHGAVLPGPIEVQSNVISRHYLDGLDPTLVKFVGLDGYDGIGGAQYATKTFAQVSGASFAYTTHLFPGTPVGFAEFNSSRTTGWAQWVAQTLTWCKTVGADTAVLFTSLDYWQKTPTQLHELATILNTP